MCVAEKGKKIESYTCGEKRRQKSRVTTEAKADRKKSSRDVLEKERFERRAGGEELPQTKYRRGALGRKNIFESHA